MKPVILYELDAIVPDEPRAMAGPLAEYLERDEDTIAGEIGAAAEYIDGRSNQGAFWEDVAERLGLAEAELLGGFAINAATARQDLLGRIRVQKSRALLGLVSDATADWVGHFRKALELDRLIQVHVINADFAIEKPYDKLLRTAAERLNTDPGQVRFVAAKPHQLQTARDLGFQTVNAHSDLATAFSDLA